MQAHEGLPEEGSLRKSVFPIIEETCTGLRIIKCPEMVRAHNDNSISAHPLERFPDGWWASS
jgi:hypothetical protein